MVQLFEKSRPILDNSAGVMRFHRLFRTVRASWRILPTPGIVIDRPLPLTVRVPETKSVTALPVPRTGTERSPVSRFSKCPV